MLNKPALNELMDHVDSKYTLVNVAAKRARDIIDSDPDLVVTAGINPVYLALKDIVDGKLHWFNAEMDNRPEEKTEPLEQAGSVPADEIDDVGALELE